MQIEFVVGFGPKQTLVQISANDRFEPKAPQFRFAANVRSRICAGPRFLLVSLKKVLHAHPANR